MKIRIAAVLLVLLASPVIASAQVNGAAPCSWSASVSNLTVTCSSPSPAPSPTPTASPTPEPTSTPSPPPSQTLDNFIETNTDYGPLPVDYYPMNETQTSTPVHTQTMFDAIGSHNGTYYGQSYQGQDLLMGVPLGIEDGSGGVDMWFDQAGQVGFANATGLSVGTGTQAKWSLMGIVRDCSHNASSATPAWLLDTMGSSADFSNGAGFLLYSGSPFGFDSATVTNDSGYMQTLIQSYGSDCHAKLLTITYDGSATGDGLTYWINGVPLFGPYGRGNIKATTSIAINAYYTDASPCANAFCGGGQGHVYGKIAVFDYEIGSAYMWAVMRVAHL